MGQAGYPRKQLVWVQATWWPQQCQAASVAGGQWVVRLGLGGGSTGQLCGAGCFGGLCRDPGEAVVPGSLAV